MIRGILFIIIGIILIIIPYAKFKEIFPKAPGPAIVKILGGVIVFCGIIIAAIPLLEY